MKNVVIDFVFVMCALCVTQILFSDYRISQTYFERSLDNFENQVVSSQVIESPVVLQDDTDNNVSLLLKGISGTCIKVIEFVVLVFSNLISMIL